MRICIRLSVKRGGLRKRRLFRTKLVGEMVLLSMRRVYVLSFQDLDNPDRSGVRAPRAVIQYRSLSFLALTVSRDDGQDQRGWVVRLVVNGLASLRYFRFLCQRFH